MRPKVTTYEELVRALSGVGFNWSTDSQAWNRKSDGAGIADESLRGFCENYPALIDLVADAFLRGAAGFSMTVVLVDGGCDWNLALKFTDAKGAAFTS